MEELDGTTVIIRVDTTRRGLVVEGQREELTYEVVIALVRSIVGDVVFLVQNENDHKVVGNDAEVQECITDRGLYIYVSHPHEPSAESECR